MISRYNTVNKGTGGAGQMRIANNANCLAISTIALAVDTLFACPIFLPAGKIDRLAFEVTGAGGAGNKARAGLFAADGKAGKLYPGKFMIGIETAEADGTVTAVKETVFSSPFDVDEGLYFIVLANGSGTLATFRGVALGGVPSFLGVSSAFAPATMITVAKAYSSTGFAAMCQSTTDLTFPTGGAYAATVPPIVAVGYSK